VSSPEAVTPQPSRSIPQSSQADYETPSSSSAGFVASLPRSKEEAGESVAELQKTIARLTSQLKEQGEIRQRKVAGALEEKGYPKAAQAVAHPNQTAGVPLQWVALLCLLSFIVAWIFF
jgi:hypothetical protein